MYHWASIFVVHFVALAVTQTNLFQPLSGPPFTLGGPASLNGWAPRTTTGTNGSGEPLGHPVTNLNSANYSKNDTSLIDLKGLPPSNASTNAGPDLKLSSNRTITTRYNGNIEDLDKSIGQKQISISDIASQESHSRLGNSLKISNATSSKHKRHSLNNQDSYLNQDCEISINRKPAIFAIRCDHREISDDGGIIVKAMEPTKITLIGRNLHANASAALTATEGSHQDDCTHMDRIKSYPLTIISSNVAEISIDLPAPGQTLAYYFCLRESGENSGWFHQGSEQYLRIYVQKDFMPRPAKMILIGCLLCLSGLFSGLNLGLMSLDKNELQVIMKCGSENERRYARAIEPVRRRGNYLLCSILFSNTLVNSTISVFLEELSDGFIAIIMSTILIVLFGEILPQAFCSRHGLAVGAKTVGLTYFCMIVTWPLSKPVSLCLDWALGEEIGHAYDRERLMEFIQVTKDINNLETDEVNIITGALKIKQMQVSEIMTKLDDVYMIEETAVLDFDTIQCIVQKGYSRIPVHEAGNKRNIVAVLFAKDLALVDPDDKTPVQAMISFYKHPRMFVYEDTTLDKVLNEFKTGMSHMAIVQRIVNEGDRDPTLEPIGIVTLEDVIEEIMQMEINDETDILSDNRRKRRRKDAQVRKDFSQFTKLGGGDAGFNVVTPQLCLAAYQYLATTVEPFSPKYLSDSIIKRLLSQKIFYKVKDDDDESQKRLYTAGQPADYFIMILEGRVHVVCGKENLFFDGGPFSFFGKAALCDLTDEDPATLNRNNPTVVTESVAGSSSPPTDASTEIASIQLAGSTSNRRESRLGRRESFAKALTGQLSLSTKKLDQTVSDSQEIQVVPTTSTSNDDQGDNMPMRRIDASGKVTAYFIPDYTVQIIANTSYLKVTSYDYQTALMATKVERTQQAGQENGDNGDHVSNGGASPTRRRSSLNLEM